jgi:hypothetical protein
MLSFSVGLERLVVTIIVFMFGFALLFSLRFFVLSLSKLLVLIQYELFDEAWFLHLLAGQTEISAQVLFLFVLCDELFPDRI